MQLNQLYTEMGLSTDLIISFRRVSDEKVLDEFQIRNLWTNLWEDHPSTPPRETGLFLNQLAQLVCSGHMTMR